MAQTRTRGIQTGLIAYFTQNEGRTLSIDELIANHPIPKLSREQIASSISHTLLQDQLPGLARGKGKGTYIYTRTTKPTPTGGFEPALIEILPAEGGGFIGVDRDGGRVYKMERIA